MPGRVKVDVLNDERILKAVAEMARAVGPEKTQKIVLRAAARIADRIRQNAPLGKTGNLKRGIFIARDQKTKVVGALVGVNYKIAPHAHLVEFGHAGKSPAPPHPFMRPAVDAEWPAQRQFIIDSIVAELERAGRG